MLRTHKGDRLQAYIEATIEEREEYIGKIEQALIDALASMLKVQELISNCDFLNDDHEDDAAAASADYQHHINRIIIHAEKLIEYDTIAEEVQDHV